MADEYSNEGHPEKAVEILAKAFAHHEKSDRKRDENGSPQHRGYAGRDSQDQPAHARPHGVVLVLENTDRPGIVGRVGTLLGEHDVNIATMSLSRNQAGGTALTVLNLDTTPGEELLRAIRASGDIHSAQVIQL